MGRARAWPACPFLVTVAGAGRGAVFSWAGRPDQQPSLTSPPLLQRVVRLAPARSRRRTSSSGLKRRASSAARRSAFSPICPLGVDKRAVRLRRGPLPPAAGRGAGAPVSRSVRLDRDRRDLGGPGSSIFSMPYLPMSLGGDRGKNGGEISTNTSATRSSRPAAAGRAAFAPGRNAPDIVRAWGAAAPPARHGRRTATSAISASRADFRAALHAGEVVVGELGSRAEGDRPDRRPDEHNRAHDRGLPSAQPDDARLRLRSWSGSRRRPDGIEIEGSHRSASITRQVRLPLDLVALAIEEARTPARRLVPA